MNRPTDIQVVARAADFAARKHTHHRRKGEAAEPYFNHLAHVAALLADAGEPSSLFPQDSAGMSGPPLGSG